MSDFPESNGKQTPRERAAHRLALGCTRKAAAAVAECSERQIYRWQHESDFILLVRQYRGEVIDHPWLLRNAAAGADQAEASRIHKRVHINMQ
jgi:hypothetical protein